MASRNYVELIGRPGADPEYKVVANDQEFASMSLATSESYKDKKTGDKVELTEWHNIVGWRHIAKSMSLIKKGKLVMVIGKIKTRKYQDKKDGSDRWITEIVADEIQFLERMNVGPSTAPEASSDHKPQSSGSSKIEMS
jgi:single-strand DNA-binding protein